MLTRPRTACSPQFEVKFNNFAHQDGMNYSITATAWNEFGESAASEPYKYTTPARPDAPVIDSVEVQPPTDREPFGSLAVTINNDTNTGGSRE